MYWDRQVITNRSDYNRSDIVLINKEQRRGIAIDIAVPLLTTFRKPEREKITKDENLAFELKRFWTLEKVDAYALVISAEELDGAEVINGNIAYIDLFLSQCLPLVKTTHAKKYAVKKMRSLTLLTLILSVVCVARCSRILVVFPMPAPSHYILGNAYAKTLAEAGHDVTMVSPFEEKNPPEKGKWRDVVLTGFVKKWETSSEVQFFDLESMNPFLNIPFMNMVGNMVTKDTLAHPNFQKLIESNEQFDVVVLEQFNNDALKVLAYHLQAPLIIFSTIGSNSWVNPLVGNPAPLSYIPESFLKYSSHMTFWERLVNLLFAVAMEVNRQLIFFPTQNKIMKEHFPDAPDLSLLNYNASLVLVNSHESTNQAVPHVPSMIDIGGYHVSPPKELPKELKEFMNNAKEGVVYFSMGSNIKPSQMSDKIRDAILKSFGKIKQKVLWKWDEDTLPGKPENVKLSKWFPQQDILAHPNTKLFITHGGLLSTIETVYHGVPVLALPVFGDQKMNAARAVENGVGISLAFSQITEETLGGALHSLLHDPKYRETAKWRSSIMHDRPIKPKDLAVYWTEFVIRHKGAPHLRVAGLDLSWYQYLLIDVIAFLAVASVLVVVLLSVLVKKICCSGKSNKKTQEKLSKIRQKIYIQFYLCLTLLTVIRHLWWKQASAKKYIVRKMRSSVLIALILSVVCAARSSRILVVFPVTAPSHYFLGNALAKTLAEAGHDVTMVSPYEEKNPPKNGTWRDVVLTNLMEKSAGEDAFHKFCSMKLNLFDLESMNPFLNIPFMNKVGDMIIQETMAHPNFQNLIKSNEHFDVVILEQFNDDALKVLAYHFQAPLILFSTIGCNSWVNPLVGNPAPPSYIPEVFLKYSSHMTFWERLVNLLFVVATEMNRHLIFFPAQNKFIKEYFPDAPDLSVLNYNVSLVLVNSHESTNHPVPHVPSMIDIGGYHVSPPKELPKDLKEFMDNATDGVVYFSMGSNIKPSQMSDKIRDAILKCLGKIKQKVLWKWDEDTFPGKPDNVKLSKWFPQQDILAHPNIKVFITHGGLLSTIETVYHGVPVLTLPVFGDQKMNAARAVENGIGLSVVFSQISEESFGSALHKLLHDPKYRETAKWRSRIMQDRPVKPKDLAVYWTEFVIRHKGAPHLRVAGLDLHWYQYLLIDVITFLLVTSIIGVIVLSVLFKKICCSGKHKEKLKKS
ncbi:hypothetical protein NQ318_011385 [Aromia moschata]|uniref:UDP-glycosyltransferases domain-containing protein n=1 Tax=Aromia moschata TaxID=1265417 RepID=A0AAV8YT63_9CUCU|nr:hypothetical protein NQ318_011385 [Aromia moschata]